LLAKPAYEWTDWIIHELHARWSAGWWRMTGENEVPIGRAELPSHLQARVIGFPAKQHRVDRLHELVHAVETFRRGA